MTPARQATPRPAPARRAGRVALALLLAAVASASAQPPERVVLTPAEHQQLLDQIERLKKQLAARKPTPPSRCKLSAKVEKRGEAAVAVVRAVYSFQTTQPGTAVLLGGKRAFPVAAALDGAKLPVLDAGDDGLAALIDAAGEHTLTLDLEAPVAARGAKGEVGFEFGLPRAVITTLALDPPGDVKRVNLTTRKPDPAGPPKPPVAVREPGLDAKAFADGRPLGPVESVEVTWDPPAAAPPAAADAVRTADWDVAASVTEAFVDTTARLRLKGSAKAWRFVAPPTADVTVERATPATPGGPEPLSAPPTLTKPSDPGKPTWKLDVPTGGNVAEWVVTAVVRQPRPKLPDVRHRGPFPVGPFAATDVFRQAGTVRVTAPANTRLAFKHGPEVRQAVAPPLTGAGPADEDATVAFFKLATGPTPASGPPPAPLLEVEARPLPPGVLVKPAYKLRLTEAGWRVRCELRITPVRSEVDHVTLDVPAAWVNPVAPQTDLVDGVQTQKGDGPRSPVVVRLAAGHKEPFDLIVDATVPVADTAREAAVPLPRFPQAQERDAAVTVTVPEGLEVRATAHEWEGDQPATWGQPLSAAPGPDGKPPKPATTLAGKFDQPVARIDVAWQPHRPELTVEVRADVTVQDRQVTVVEEVRLRSPDGFARPVRFKGPADATGWRGPALDSQGGREWLFAPSGPDAAKEAASFTLSYALPLPPRAADDRSPRKLAVGLLWPAAATRTDATVRVWSATSNGVPHALAPAADGWRTLPPDAGGDADTLPSLTLAGSGIDLPLVLEVKDAADAGLAAVQVERTAVEAWVGDGGGVSYRARFLLRRWLAPAVDVEVPGPPTGPPPTVLLDGKKADATPLPADDGPRLYRVTLPDPRPARPLVLEVQGKHAGGGSPWGDTALDPPRLRAVSSGSAPRWHVSVAGGTVPLLFDTTVGVDQRWRWRGLLPEPTAAATADDLDRWFREGTNEPDPGRPPESPDDAGSLAFRQPALGPVSLSRVPRLGLVAAASLLTLVVGLALSRLGAGAAGALVLLLGGALAAAAAVAPQPAAAAAAAAQPGVLALVAILGTQAALRAYYRRRAEHLPGFTRTRTADDGPASGVSAPIPPSARTGASKGSAVPGAAGPG